MSSVGNRGCRVNSYQLSTMQVVRRRTARHRQSSDLGAATMHRGGRFAQLVIRRFLGLVYRVVALSPVVAAPEGIARASAAGWGSSAGLRRLGSVYSGWAATSSPVNPMTRFHVAKLDLLPPGMSG